VSPLDALVPMYEPDSAVAMASTADEPPPEFLFWPKFEAKLQLARGIQMFDQGQPDRAIAPLRSSVMWYRDYGGPETFCYYFLAAEFHAVALAGQGDLKAAYAYLEQAAGKRKLVNSLSAPLHQRILARQSLLARELGRTAEAEAIEAELKKALIFADHDHPILLQIRDQQGAPLEIE